MLNEKRCPACGEDKPIGKFYEYPNENGRLSPRCKLCAKQVNAEKYQRRKRGLVGRESTGKPVLAVGAQSAAESAAESDFKTVYGRLKARRDALRKQRRGNGGHAVNT